MGSKKNAQAAVAAASAPAEEPSAGAVDNGPTASTSAQVAKSSKKRKHNSEEGAGTAPASEVASPVKSSKKAKKAAAPAAAAMVTANEVAAVGHATDMKKAAKANKQTAATAIVDAADNKPEDPINLSLYNKSAKKAAKKAAKQAAKAEAASVLLQANSTASLLLSTPVATEANGADEACDSKKRSAKKVAKQAAKVAAGAAAAAAAAAAEAAAAAAAVAAESDAALTYVAADVGHEPVLLNGTEPSSAPGTGTKSGNPSDPGSGGTASRAFQRVKAEEWLGKKGSWDNSYAGTFGQEGWGAKAQEVLGAVRGKDFRHEKTKKKRGSYRGGLIDVDATMSIKFPDSDDE